MTPASYPLRKSLLQLGAVSCVLSLFAMGCSFTRNVTTPRSGWNQILTTVAADRALEQLEWPAVEGKTVYVQVGPPGDALDVEYLRRAVEVTLAEKGARIASELEQADHVLTCLVGAFSLDIGGRFFGLEGTSGGFVPLTIPELMLYRRVTRRGYTKVEIAMVDKVNGGVVHRSGPVEGMTRRRSSTFFFVFRFSESDTSRLE
jgi:hypothetical protein